MRLRAPILFLLTLFFITKARIIQFSQHLKLILALSIYSYHLLTLTKSGGMTGGMKWPLDTGIDNNRQQGVQ